MDFLTNVRKAKTAQDFGLLFQKTRGINGGAKIGDEYIRIAKTNISFGQKVMDSFGVTANGSAGIGIVDNELNVIFRAEKDFNLYSLIINNKTNKRTSVKIPKYAEETMSSFRGTYSFGEIKRDGNYKYAALIKIKE